MHKVFQNNSFGKVTRNALAQALLCLFQRHEACGIKVGIDLFLFRSKGPGFWPTYRIWSNSVIQLVAGLFFLL